MGSSLSGILGTIGSGVGTAASDVGGALGSIGSGLQTGVNDLGGFLGSLFGGGGGAPTGVPASAGLGAAAAAPVVAPSPAPITTGGAGAGAVANPFGATGGAPTGSGAAPSVLSQVIGDGSGGVTPHMPAQTISPPDTINIPGLSSTPLPGSASGSAPTASASPPKSDFLKNLLGTGVVGLDLIKGLQPPPGVSALKTLAGQEGQIAKSAQASAQAENQGLLPAGAESLVQQNLNTAISAIKSNYAKMGMSGSSAETADINAARQAALAQTFEIGQGLAKEGLAQVSSASGLEGTLLGQILTAETAQDTGLGQSLAAFAGATAK